MDIGAVIEVIEVTVIEVIYRNYYCKQSCQRFCRLDACDGSFSKYYFAILQTFFAPVLAGGLLKRNHVRLTVWNTSEL